ncbi:MAG: hypothetical protein Q9157_006955 [Trypethelium eluteriae]
MCPSAEENGNANGHANGVNGTNGVNGISRFQIIESTLREGEQFANAWFDTQTKIKIAKALDELGVDYIELTSPAASEQSYEDCKTICKLGFKAKVLTHIRCNMQDAKLACDCGVDGVDVVIGTSRELPEGAQSWEGHDLTVGCASPRQVYDLVRTLRGVVSCEIECHFHDDTGCSIANAYCALEAGATHIDTSVLGIGERNGITKLDGFMARMIVADRDYVKSKYRLEKIKEIENLVAESVQVNIPFKNPITGFSAFTHKSGIHQKAILANSSTYEIINPEDFGMTRYVHFASRITGWNAIKSRVEQLGLKMSDEQVKLCTAKIKAMADVRPLAVDDADSIIRAFHSNLAAKEEQPLLDDLTEKEKAQFVEKEKELNGVGEKRGLEQVVDEQADVPLAKKTR